MEDVTKSNMQGIYIVLWEECVKVHASTRTLAGIFN